MDKMRFHSILLLGLFAVSCSSDRPEPEEFQEIKEPEMVSVKMSFKGEVSVSQSPLKNSETASTDLFGIQFYDNTIQPYAYVVGDDISQLAIDLHKEQEYRIKATYIKNGKELLHYSPEIGEYSNPLISELRSGPILNQVNYSSTDHLPFISHVDVHDVALDSYKYAEIDRYYGYVPSFTTTIEDVQTLTLDLKRMIFGLKLRFDLGSLEDQNVDQIRFSVNGYGERVFALPVSEGVATLEIPYLTIAVPEYLNSATALDFAMENNYSEDISISIGTFDNYTRYFDGVITVQRNKMMVIDHILEEQETVGGGFGS